MEGVEVSEAPSLHGQSVQAGEDGEAEAPSRGDLAAFVKSEHNSALFYYFSEISIVSRHPYSLIFNVVLKRRRRREIDHESDHKSRIFRVVETDILKAIRTLVACSTWTHAEFSFFKEWHFYQEEFAAGFEHLICEVFSLLRSCPSLSCFGIRNPWFCYKQLPTLLYENPRLETLIVYPSTFSATNFSALAKIIALCLSQNSALKSFTIHLSCCDFNSNRESLEILLRPFTTRLQIEANADLKELVLQFPEFIGSNAGCENAIANLVRYNTTLEKLELRFLDSRSRLKDGTCKDIGRALEVNQTLKEFGCFCDVAGLKELIASFVPDPLGRQPNITLSTLRLFLSLRDDHRRGKAFMDDLVVILKDLASMLELNTTLKHVQVCHEWDRYWSNSDDVMWTNRAQVEFGTQEELKLMICNELRVNTSLEHLAVGFWKLSRVGTEWQTTYGGPCLREKQRPTQEYIVKVKMPS